MPARATLDLRDAPFQVGKVGGLREITLDLAHAREMNPVAEPHR
jgi:hypothetical protein